MKKFDVKKIVIPIDFSDTSYLVIEHGIYMAKLFEAELILVNVLEKNWNEFTILASEVIVREPTKLIEIVEQKLEDIADSILEKHGVSSEVLATTGSVCNEIVNIAKENEADLIVMGSHGVSGIEEFFVGSNTYKVVTRSKCPVLSIQLHVKNQGFSTIVFPIDNSDHSRQKVNHVAVLAKTYGAKVHVLGILDEREDSKEEAQLKVKISEIESYFESINVVSNLKLVKGKNHAALTIDYASEVNADLIAIMTDQDDEGVFLSSYAQQVVNHSPIPVLSVTPEDNPDIPWVKPY